MYNHRAHGEGQIWVLTVHKHESYNQAYKQGASWIYKHELRRVNKGCPGIYKQGMSEDYRHWMSGAYIYKVPGAYKINSLCALYICIGAALISMAKQKN